MPESMSDLDMYKLIMDECSKIRAELIQHTSDEMASFQEIRKDMTEKTETIQNDIAAIRIKLENQGVKLGSITAFIAMIVAAITSWFAGQFR